MPESEIKVPVESAAVDSAAVDSVAVDSAYRGRSRFIVIDLAKTLGVIVWTVAMIALATVVRLASGHHRRALAMARSPWADNILRLTGFSVECDGAEAVDWSRPYFVAANHQSFLDIPVLFHLIPNNLYFVVKKELSRVPVLAGYIRTMGMIFVDRSNPEAARQSIRDAAAAAAGGKTILLFPEGTRSRDGRLLPLKTGMLAAAIESGVPILPVVLEGTGEGMAPAWIPRYRPRRLRALFGRPIETADFSPNQRRELGEGVRDALLELQERLG